MRTMASDFISHNMSNNVIGVSTKKESLVKLSSNEYFVTILAKNSPIQMIHVSPCCMNIEYISTASELVRHVCFVLK